MKAIADVLHVARSNLNEQLRLQTAPQAAPAVASEQHDGELVAEIKALVGTRPTYGYRRVTAMLNRARRDQGGPPVNHKRVYRVMREHRLLLARYTGKTTQIHDGKVATLKSDLRWCTDIFQINCTSGERVFVAFALDCCDRSALGFIAKAEHLVSLDIQDLATTAIELRFGSRVCRTPHPLEWLSDNGPQFTSKDTQAFLRSAGFLVRTTPAYSPESNGIAEAFVKTFKRDYVHVGDVSSAQVVLQRLPEWFADYNSVHPHKALGMRSPAEFRRIQFSNAA